MKEELERIIAYIQEKTRKNCFQYKISKEKPNESDSILCGIPYEDYPLDSYGEKMPELAQINLKELGMKGIIQLFINHDFLTSDIRDCEVRYYEKKPKKKEKLVLLDLKDYITDVAYKLEISPCISYMPVNNHNFSSLFEEAYRVVFKEDCPPFDTMDLDDYFDFEGASDIFYEAFQDKDGILLGYPDFKGRDPRQCMDLSIDSYDLALLKLDVALKESLHLGEGGVIHIMIPSENFEKLDFSNVKFYYDSY